MPQFMQRAAWSRVSFSERGTTNSWKCFTRSGTGTYLRSCRSISRKPVILPIKPDAPESLNSSLLLFRHLPVIREERSGPNDGLYHILQQQPLRRVSKDEASSWPHGSRRQGPPHHEDNQYAPIAIFGSASALAFNSFSARRYSTGITLRNFGSHFAQFARISAARLDPVRLAWRVIRMCSRSTSDSSRLANTSTRPWASRSPVE